MPRPKPFVALYGQVDFDRMVPADDISGTDIFPCRQGADGDNVFATADQMSAFFVAVVPDPLLLGDGTAAAPSYSFASSPGTGVFLNTANQLALAAGGLKCMSVSESGGARQIGFYDGSPIPLQTGVAVTTAAVHAALVSLRLITA